MLDDITDEDCCFKNSVSQLLPFLSDPQAMLDDITDEDYCFTNSVSQLLPFPI